MTPLRTLALGSMLTAALGCHAAHPAPPKVTAPPPPLAVPGHSLVTVEAIGLSRLIAPAGDPDFALRIRVTAPPLAADERAPIELALVLDTSGSMEGDAITAAGDAARRVIDRMGPRDRVALVGFGSRAERLLPMTRLDAAGRAAALAALDHLRATGTTDLAGGLGAGLAELTGNHLAPAIERLVLLSDGVPNDGEDLAGLVAGAVQSRIAISTLGVGLEFDEALLGRIASDTGGAYRYAPDADGVARMFDDEIGHMETIVASNLEVVVRPGPGVVLGDAPWLSAVGGARKVFLGDLAAGETRDVFVPVRIGAHVDGAAIEVADVDVDFYDAATSAREDRHAYVGLTASADPSAVAASVAIGLSAARARAQAAGVILQAINLARQGAIDQAERLLTDGEATARAAAEAAGDDDLAGMARRMVELRKSLVFLRTTTTAAVVQPPPLGGPPPVAKQPSPEPMADAPYPLDRRPTPDAPAAVEATLKDAYGESRATVFHP